MLECDAQLEPHRADRLGTTPYPRLFAPTNACCTHRLHKLTGLHKTPAAALFMPTGGDSIAESEAALVYGGAELAQGTDDAGLDLVHCRRSFRAALQPVLATRFRS